MPGQNRIFNSRWRDYFFTWDHSDNICILLCILWYYPPLAHYFCKVKFVFEMLIYLQFLLVRYDATESCLMTDVSQQRKILKRRYYSRHVLVNIVLIFWTNLLPSHNHVSLWSELVMYLSCLHNNTSADIIWLRKQKMQTWLVSWLELLE